MRWLVGWSRPAARAAASRDGTEGNGVDAGTVHPVGAHLLWADPDPLWAVGDWRPDEVRLIRADSGSDLAVLGCCGASDEALRAGLAAARGGALRHLTSWPGSYTAVVRVGRRVTVTADLAGLRPVFHTPWAGGTAYATAALPLADLVEAELDIPYLAGLLALPESPEALGDRTPYTGVRRVPPGHALILRDGGSREVAAYEPTTSRGLTPSPATDVDTAVDGVREALVEAVRTRLAAPRHTAHYDPGPVPGNGPADRRAARGGPAPGVGADLSGGPASATVALLAATLPGRPGTLFGDDGREAGERLSAVTFNDLTAAARNAPGPGGEPSRAHPGAHTEEMERARLLGGDPRFHHVVVPGGDDTLPYADLHTGPLTDEPGPSLALTARHRARLAGGSADHFVGSGARQVLDAHPARLADLLLDRRRRHLLRPVAALARAEAVQAAAALADGAAPGPGRTVRVPLTVYRAARGLARTPYRDGLAATADALRAGHFSVPGRAAVRDATGVLTSSLAALTWCRPGPAARWLTSQTLADVALSLEAAAAARTAAERPGEYRAAAALARRAADHRVLEQAAELRGQRLHAPYFDNQVVRACRELPLPVRVQPGTRVAVLRAVLAGSGVHDLPPGWGAPSRATQAASVRAGLRAAAGSLSGLFDAPLLAEAGLVDARSVRAALRAVADGAPVPVDGLADLVVTEVWLRRLLARRGSCWTGAAAPRQRAAAGGVTAGVHRPAL